jgi:AhpD family alkylhydroperoxidase
MNYSEISKDTYQYLIKSYQSLKNSPLDPTTRALIDLRVSQINGCDYCCNLHQEEARNLNISQQKLDSLEYWHASEDFTIKEKAAIKWCEAITRLEKNHSKIRDSLASYFNEKEIVDVTFAISIMNALNRIAINLRN